MLQLHHGFLKHFGLDQQLLLVSHQHVAPQVRVARGNAGKVSKTGASQRQIVASMGLVVNGVHQCKSNQVGQVANSGVSGVMRLGGHFKHLATQSRPQVGSFLQLHGLCAFNRG